MELTVLGCSGSFSAPPAGPCSGYLVRHGSTAIWMDCGNGTFAHLQEHVSVEDLDAVVITHEHPDHCVDVYGLHILLRYGMRRSGFPVLGPEGLEGHLGQLVDGDWGGTFSWNVIDDEAKTRVGEIDLRFSRTDHPPPTYAVEASAAGKRLVYTADTGPGWTIGAFGSGADLVLSEATYLDGDAPDYPHLTAREAGLAAREAGAHRLILTHLWPGIDRRLVVAEGSEAFGDSVVLAAPHLTCRV
ncbi:MAG: MBL fold metallo-hydrolase [Acidimicrobiia bacterium]